MNIYYDSINTPLVAPREKLNFFHQKKCTIPIHISALESYYIITSDVPFIIRKAFWLRDKLSFLGGVKPIKGFYSHRPQVDIKKGDNLDFFDVIKVNVNELFLLSNDKHLTVLLAFQLSTDSGKKCLIVTTSVITHNFFGDLYMLPVSSLHGVILNHMLQKIIVKDEVC